MERFAFTEILIARGRFHVHQVIAIVGMPEAHGMPEFVFNHP